jgi:hypothetical protein
MFAFEQFFYQIRTNKTSTTGYQVFHYHSMILMIPNDKKNFRNPTQMHHKTIEGNLTVFPYFLKLKFN